jgi:hypothetical protein
VAVGAGLLLALSTLSAGTAAAQTVEGRLLDAFNDLPIPEALVALMTPEGVRVATATTDEDGRFTLRAGSPGRYVLFGHRTGYLTSRTDPFDLEDGDPIEVMFRIRPRPVATDSLVVRAEPIPPRVPHLVDAGFYQRRKMGFGHFIPPEEIERRQPLRFHDLLRGIPGVRVDSEGGITLRGGYGTSMGFCPPRFFLDGVPLDDREAVEQLPALEVAAVEVYRGAAQVPPQYGGATGACGVVVVWLKR